MVIRDKGMFYLIVSIALLLLYWYMMGFDYHTVKELSGRLVYWQI
ncbi:hypothetical protein Dtox_3902 [Desulfofarcimen acetoxidans DSM 771]|uniref:Uncharacterized protein n=1 Tax=Desulfofarcimen acetoxidans (strain ATCC 49208 / DSM 771 / KCTC 5769 / VKM B-1644 / 5575) TaxID=485916 RepID=C8VXW6_DESAS|nr:hypothetical protein Dtox_3902 [Desulfofarcimen acetoxidans DSM 771]